MHPLRMQRWAISDRNPFLAPLGKLAAATKDNRAKADPKGPCAVMERAVAANIVAGWDLYRQLRDATVENLFFNAYGTMSLATGRGRGGGGAPAAETEPTEVQDALAHIEEGGFTDAAVRAGLIAVQRGHGQRRLSRMKRIRELVGDKVGLLALPEDEARAIIQ